MSPVNSNNGRRAVARALWLLGACATVTGCARGGETSGALASSAPLDSRIGYVRMDELVKVHPLYSQLARLDEDMQALQLKSVGSEIALSGADLAKEEKALQKELDAAAARTKAALVGKEQEYTRREQAAIDAALGAGAGVTGPGGAQIAGSISAQGQAQAQAVTQIANRNLNAYRKELVDQDRRAERALQQALAESAERSYRAEADQVQKAESDYALQLASADAGPRLSLRTKLSNLALDDASRADVKSQLDAIDRKESDALGAMKNRDTDKLVALQKSLHDKMIAQLNVQVARIRKRTIGKLNERTADTQHALIGQIGRVGGGPGGAPVAGGVSPEMKAKLLALHQKFQHDFNDDASKTVAQFQKTRADLMRRFAQISGVDVDSQAAANKQMSALQKQRGDLYNEMVEQIGREVKVIAEQRGINVVVSDVVAPAGGVDLTADAEKDIESLHE